MKEIYLNLLGINELWSQKKIIEPRVMVSFDNLTNEGLVLLKNMLSTIVLTIDNEQVQLKGSLPSNFLQNNVKSQTIFLISDLSGVTNSKKIFSCPHPNKLIQDNALKSESWKTMVAMNKALNEIN